MSYSGTRWPMAERPESLELTHLSLRQTSTWLNVANEAILPRLYHGGCDLWRSICGALRWSMVIALASATSISQRELWHGLPTLSYL